MGFFLDKAFLNGEEAKEWEKLRRDASTGVLNAQGLYEEALSFRDEYYLRNVDFARIHVAIDNIHSINMQYGYDIGDKALLMVVKELMEEHGLTSAVGRYRGNQFAVFTQVRYPGEMKEIIERIKSLTAKPRRIDGLDVTFYISVGYALFSEGEDLEELTHRAEICRRANQHEHTDIESRFAGAAELFHVYDDLPISFAVIKVIGNEEGRIRDAEIIYVNNLCAKRAGKAAKDIVGLRTRALFPKLSQDWYTCAERSALHGESVSKSMRLEELGKSFYVTSSMVIRKGYCSFTFQKVEEILQAKEEET